MGKTIAVGDTRIELDDLAEMNKSELVKIIRMMGVPAHRGLSRKVLVSLLVGRKRKIRNKADEYRRILTEFLKKYWDAVESQVDVKCHGECSEHTDFQVVTCWKTNRETLERY